MVLAVRWLTVTAFVRTPVAALAQASISGTVRDGSGGVLPRVTVESSTPTLIERVRSTVTDGTGQYRIVELRPGTYSMTFIAPSLGRNLLGGAANATRQPRRAGNDGRPTNEPARCASGEGAALRRDAQQLNLDVFNALNASSVQTLNNNFAVWQRPNSIITARFARIGVQLDY